MPRSKVERRPRAEGGAPDDSTVGGKSLTSLLEPAGDLDELARVVDGAFVVVVRVTGDRYKRRAYLTAKAAEDAARRATDRGESATVYLAELKPLYRLAGGGS